MIGVPNRRSILLTSTVVFLAGIFVFAWQHELRPRSTPQAAPEASPRAEPRALTPEEESYAVSLWEIHREVTPSAVAISFAGIRGLAVPASLSKVHGQYLEAMTLYRKASNEMLEFTKDGARQHLIDAQGMGTTASEDLLRAGEVLWPGQYKPH